MNDLKYKNIISLPHHTSKTHMRMSLNSRAAQFAPFAALSGYEEELSETARLTDERIELDDDKEFELNEKMRIIMDNADKQPAVRILEFFADKKKSGGCYKSRFGNIRRIDEYNRTIIFTDGTVIHMDNIYSIEGEIFNIQ